MNRMKTNEINSLYEDEVKRNFPSPLYVAAENSSHRVSVYSIPSDEKRSNQESDTESSVYIGPHQTVDPKLFFGSKDLSRTI